MRKRMLFFVNPNAGHAEIRTRLMDVIDFFTRSGYDVTVHPTARPGELTEWIAAEGERYDVITVTGGDGTVNEAVGGLMRLDCPPPLGYLPSGTVNDVAATLKLPKNLLESAAVVTEGRAARIDLGQFNGRWFAYVAAFGAFTSVPYATAQSDKRLLGRMAYLLRSVMSLGEIRPIPIRASWDGQTVSDNVILGLVASTTSVGGFRAKPSLGVSLDDGLSEVILVREIKTMAELNAAASAALRQDFKNEFFYQFRTDQITFEFEQPVAWTLDGEYGGSVSRAEIRNRRRALRILIPPEASLPTGTEEGPQ